MQLPSILTSRLGAALRVAVTAAVLVLVLRAVDWTAFGALAEKVRWPVLLLAAACMGLAYPLHAVRLGILLRQQNIRLPFRELHRVTWISIFFGSFTPGGVGGDVSRLVHMYGRVPDNKAGGTAAVTVDRVIGLATLLLLAVVATFAYRQTTQAPAREIAALLPVFVVALAGLAIGWSLLTQLPERGMLTRLPSFDRLAPVRLAIRQALRPVTPLALAAGVSLAIWSVDFLAGWLLARALGWPVGLLEISIALAVAYAVSSLPISLGGHGVREGALVVVLGWFGLAEGAPLLAVAFLALTLFWALAGGLVFLVAPPDVVQPP